MNPTISVLWKIANGYKVSFTSLVDQPRERPTIVRGGDVHPIEEDGGRYLNYPTFTFDEKKSFETYRIQIHGGGFFGGAVPSAGVRGICNGVLRPGEIGVGEERYALETGDSLRFPADQPHSYRNPGEEDVWLSMLIWYTK